MSTRFERPVHFGKDIGPARDIAQTERDRAGFEASASDRKGGRIAANARRPGGISAVQRPVDAGAQHFPVYIADDGAAAAAFQETFGNIAGAARDIQQHHTRSRIQAILQGGFPQPVQPARHQIVHQVIAPGDGVEDAPDQARMFRDIDPAEAEINFAARTTVVACA